MLGKRERVNKSTNVCLAMKYSGQFWRPLATFRNVRGKRGNIALNFLEWKMKTSCNFWQFFPLKLVSPPV